jgi:hypothetical protein
MHIRLICLTLLTTIAAAAQAEEFSWPQELAADNGTVVVIYQPQVEIFSGNDLEARAAVSLKSPATDNVPVFGAIWFKARLDTDRESRTALIRDIEVVDIRFADASDAQKQQLAGFIETEIEGAGFTISIDHLLADLDGSDVGAATTNLKHEPPKIMLSRKPAILVTIDGDPVFETVENTNYERVVNTPFLLARGGIEYYLYIGSNAWYESRAIAGPWARAQRVPEELSSLVEPADDDDANVDDIHIIVASEPTELIVSDGDPSWSPVEGMDLLYMDNSDSNAFLELSTQKYYVLLSGRWYRSEGVRDAGIEAKAYLATCSGNMYRTTNCQTRSAISLKTRSTLMYWRRLRVRRKHVRPCWITPYRKLPRSIATTRPSALNTMALRSLHRLKTSKLSMHRTPATQSFATAISITPAMMAFGMSQTAPPGRGL